MDHNRQTYTGDGTYPSMNRSAPSKPSRELKVEDALLYLDQVKLEFSDRPQIYNEFLDIMKNFKSQSISTPGVIERVKTLFRGNQKLILGFNTFLPEGEGYKIELTPEEMSLHSSIAAANAAAGSGAADDFGSGGMLPVSSAGTPNEPPLKPPAGSGPAPQMQQQHAISYVTTIRNRFADEPEIYRTFLRILHTYQKEQKGIKEVLEQVSQLFADQSDLLMEFTYFLPDAVQEQAKERLQRAVREAEMRKQKMLTKKAAQASRDKDSRGSRVDKSRSTAGTSSRSASRKRSAADASSASMSQLSNMPHTISTERRFFDQVRELFMNTSPSAYTELVKCLDLYSRDAISRKDVLTLVQDLFLSANCGEMFEDFKNMLSTKAAFDSSAHDLWYSVPLSEINFSQCRKCSPSYRTLPLNYPPATCSSRIGAPETATLNDQWVSIPIGSEESYSFKHMRRNQFEEALFRSEDERFEIDMVTHNVFLILYVKIIETNMSTIRLLEPIAEEIANLRLVEDADGVAPRFTLQLDKGALGVVHLNSISRIYGEQGKEILELLRRNPRGAIPVILKRLKQKDLEWRKARQNLIQQWKDVLLANYDKSLDHRSFYYKQQDKKALTVASIIADIKTVSQLSGIANGGTETQPPNAVGEDATICKLQEVTYLLPTELENLSAGMTPHLCLRFSNKATIIHRDVFRLLSHAVENSTFTSVEKEKISLVWRDLLRPLYNLPLHFTHSHHPPTSATAAAESSTALYPVGTEVVTVYGTGKVLGPGEDGVIVVTLDWGARAFLRPDMVLGPNEISEKEKQSIGSAPPAPEGSDALRPPCRLFYGTQLYYALLRLYHIMFSRLSSAYELAVIKSAAQSGEVEVKGFLGRYNETTPDGQDTNKHLYPIFLTQLMGLIDNSIDNNRYEENCRNILGNSAYHLFTMDKVVHQSLKCLHAIANDDTAAQLITLFTYYRSQPSVCPAQYMEHVARVLSTTLEEVYRLQFITTGVDCDAHILACQYLGYLEARGGVADNSNAAAPPLTERKAKLEVTEDDDDDVPVEEPRATTASSAAGDTQDEMEEEPSMADSFEPAVSRERAMSQAFTDMLAAADEAYANAFDGYSSNDGAGRND